MASLDDRFEKLVAQMGSLVSSKEFQTLKEYLYPGKGASKQIKSIVSLCKDLQSSGRLAKDDVDTFFDALVKCKLAGAASLMKTYVENTGVKSNIDYELTCKEHDEKMELFCNTCNKRICYACVFEDHRGDNHQILTQGETQIQIEHKKAEIIQSVDELEKGVDFRHKGASNNVTIERQCQEQYDLGYFLVDQHEKEAFGVKSNVEYDDTPADEELTCKEHDEKIELFCNTCNKRICYGGVFEDHHGDDHQILKKGEIQKQIEHEKSEIIQRLDEIEKGIDNLKSISKNKGASNNVTIERQFQEQYDLWCFLVDEHEKEVFGKLESHKSKFRRDSESMGKKLEQYNEELSAIKSKLEGQESNADASAYHFKQLKTWEGEIQKINEKIQSELKSSDDGSHVYLSFSPISNDGRFVNFHNGTVVGTISIGDLGAAIVRDERGYGRGVTLTSVSSIDETPFWTRQIDDIGTEFPVVIAGSLYVFAVGKPKILIASGTNLAVIAIDREGATFTIAKKEITKLRIPDNRYVTAITSIESGSQDAGLLVAENGSTVVYRLTKSLEHFHTLDCRSCVQSISAMGCVDDNVGIIDSVTNEVVIVSGDGQMTTSCRLRPPKAMKATSRGKCIQWDGSFWSIIWESADSVVDEGPFWQQAIYKKDGTEFPTKLVSGSCLANTEVVSISFTRNQSLVCFSDGKLKVFPTCE